MTSPCHSLAVGSQLDGWGPTFSDLAVVIRRLWARFLVWARRLDVSVFENPRRRWPAVLFGVLLTAANVAAAYAKRH